MLPVQQLARGKQRLNLPIFLLPWYLIDNFGRILRDLALLPQLQNCHQKVQDRVKLLQTQKPLLIDQLRVQIQQPSLKLGGGSIPGQPEV